MVFWKTVGLGVFEMASSVLTYLLDDLAAGAFVAWFSHESRQHVAVSGIRASFRCKCFHCVVNQKPLHLFVDGDFVRHNNVGH